MPANPTPTIRKQGAGTQAASPFFKRVPATIPTRLEAVPAPSRRGRSRTSHLPLMEAAMDHPGEWFRLASYNGQTVAATAAVQFRQGSKVLPDDTSPHDWEFGAEQLENGGSELRFRFIGATE